MSIVHEAGHPSSDQKQYCVRCGIVISAGPPYAYWQPGFVIVISTPPFIRMYNGGDLRYDLCNAP